MPQRLPPSPGAFDRVVESLIPEHFELPRPAQPASFDDYRSYLKSELDRYVANYHAYVKPITDDVISYTGGALTPLTDKIEQLTNGLLTTVDYYYRGQVFQAGQTFKTTLDEVGFSNTTAIEHLAGNRSFYRARAGSTRRFTTGDLFHHPFESRGLVGTNRYSIPGLPALYLGDSAYVCWEELNQPSFSTLCFSRFENTRALSVVKIQRLPDFLAQLGSVEVGPNLRYTLLLRYLSLFPLSIACCIRTRSPNDTFKPEYVIPQLLLQYVADAKETIAGIMYPSTKVDYNRVQNVRVYNYVFPVKNIQSRGHCSDLASLFTLTEPTSIELESIASYGNLRPLTQEDYTAMGDKPQRLAIVADDLKDYLMTGFGFIERTLRGKIPRFVAD